MKIAIDIKENFLKRGVDITDKGDVNLVCIQFMDSKGGGIIVISL